MVITRRLLSIFLLGWFFGPANLFGFMIPIRLTDVALKPSYHFGIGTRFQFSVLGEAGIHNHSFDDDGNSVNFLQMLNKNQNTLAMLKGFPADSPITELLELVNATDDGVRGHMVPSGCLHYHYGLCWGGRYWINEELSFQGYLPFYDVSLTNVSWCDLTKDVTPADERVKELLTGRIHEVVQEFGCGLDIGCWHRKGLGDLSLTIEWNRRFKQNKPFLKDVYLVGRSSLVLPTGLKRDEDKVLALPFGTDGAVGITFGAGLGVTLGCYVRAGFDVDLIHIFGNERLRRIRVYPEQTNLIYLKKAAVYRDPGLTQKFNLFLDLFDFYKGFSCKVDYQFVRHGDDTISVAGRTVSTTIANSGSNLSDWTTHTIFAKVGYDFKCHLSDCARVIPWLWVYGKVPVNGIRSTQFSSVGVILGLEF